MRKQHHHYYVSGYDVAFLLDTSTSIGGKSNFKLALSFIVAVYQALGVSAQIRVAFIIFGSSTNVVFGFSKYTSFTEVKAAVEGVSMIGGACTAGAALATCKTDVFASARAEVARVLVVMMAGKSTDSVALSSSSIKEMGISILCVGMGSSFDREQLTVIATSAKYILIAAEYAELSGLSGQCVSLIKSGRFFFGNLTVKLWNSFCYKKVINFLSR